LSAGRRGDSQAVNNAMARAIDLFEATAENLAQTDSGRLKEVLRAKDQFLQIVFQETYNSASAHSIERYFTQFAIAARSKR
jgi:hypothetical protein